MAPIHLSKVRSHSDIWVAIASLSLIAVTFFSIFSLRGAKLLFAGILGASLLAALLIRARRRDGEP